MAARKSFLIILLTAAILTFILGCAAFRSEIKGGTTEERVENFGAKPVSVLFVFSHSKQVHGLDAIPKLE